MPNTGTLTMASSGSTTLPHGSARQLLITVLGELVWPIRQPVWTSALLHIFKGLGIEEQTARQALARASASGWIEPERHGREVRWSLTSRLCHIFETGSKRVYSLSDPYTNWDGTWLGLWTTVPQSLRKARRPLYAGLTWAGLGNPVPGLWLTPHVERADEVAEVLDQLALKEHTIAFRGTVDAIGISQREIVERGWDLDGLRAHYEQVWRAMDGLAPSGDDEILNAHIRLIGEWQEFPRQDPQLPEALLPDWIGRKVARRIEAFRAQWTPIVRRRFAEINTDQH